MQAKPQAGVKVFGSAVLRVEPDLVAIQFGVARHAKQPREAFRDTRQAAQKVRAFLAQAGFTDVAGSHITLSQTFDYSGGRNRSTGYEARISFNVLLADLHRLEEILVGVVDAGADQI